MVALRFSLPWFIPFNSIFQFQLVYQSCPVALFLPKPVAQGHFAYSKQLIEFIFLCYHRSSFTSLAGELEQCCKQDLTVGVWYMLMIHELFPRKMSVWLHWKENLQENIWASAGQSSVNRYNEDIYKLWGSTSNIFTAEETTVGWPHGKAG